MINPKLEEALTVYDAITKLKGMGSCIIAGGMPRDVLNDKPFTDVDIVYQRAGGPIYLPHLYKILSDKLDAKCITLKTGENSFGGLISVQRFRAGYNEYDLIYKSNPKTYVQHRFDFGICNVYYDHSEGFVKHREYIRDIEEKTITINLNKFESDADEWLVGRAFLHHLKKIQKKYPDHELRVIQ